MVTTQSFRRQNARAGVRSRAWRGSRAQRAALPFVAGFAPLTALAQNRAHPRAAARRDTGQPPARPAPQPGTRVVMLGTHGGPGIERDRAQTSSAVVVDGVPYLVDCGYGSLRQLVLSTIGYQQLDAIFFTHLHDDHTSDLPALMSLQWTGGAKKTPTEIYGPNGTARLVDAALDVPERERRDPHGRRGPNGRPRGRCSMATTSPRPRRRPACSPTIA